MNIRLNKIVAPMLAALFAAPACVAVAADEPAEHHSVADAGAMAPAAAMANMQKMREQMAALRATKDPKERARLMDEHMQAMQSTMQQMRQDNGCTMMGNGMAMKDGKPMDGMNMMQMMMEQMQQHQDAMHGAGK
jgi:hypothetical protein